jgi:DNA-directed RNA polymerase specialized sigma24 family protein
MWAKPAQLFRHLSGLAPLPASDLAPDAVLLERFVGGREEVAFTVLVARHGPMVLRLCRRVLGNAHDAEDAFQATFLVLARKAGAIRRRDHLAAWLHGTAYRLALKALAARARLPRGEASAAVPEPADPATGRSGWGRRSAGRVGDAE